MGQLSLTRNIEAATSLDDLKRQVATFVSQLEDHLNGKVDIFLINSARSQTRAMESIKKGDLVFDFKIPGVATLQQWDGKKFITFNLSNLEGTIDLIVQGSGSGNDPTLYLRSDGAGGWVLDTPPIPVEIYDEFPVASDGQTNFGPLTYTPATGEVYINGLQQPHSEFSFSTNTLIFSDGTGIIAGDTIGVSYLH